jgi:hypothetical protein
VAAQNRSRVPDLRNELSSARRPALLRFRESSLRRL